MTNYLGCCVDCNWLGKLKLFNAVIFSYFKLEDSPLEFRHKDFGAM